MITDWPDVDSELTVCIEFSAVSPNGCEWYIYFHTFLESDIIYKDSSNIKKNIFPFKTKNLKPCIGFKLSTYKGWVNHT